MYKEVAETTDILAFAELDGEFVIEGLQEFTEEKLKTEGLPETE